MVQRLIKDLIGKKSNAAPKSSTDSSRDWIGVDLDGTLATYTGWRGIKHIGKPVPLMKQRVLEWIEAGQKVKIITPRALVPEGIKPVQEWLRIHGFPELEVTAPKGDETPPTLSSRDWIGVDLDGTLATYNGWRGIKHIGKPVPLMKQRVLEWIGAGQKVKIVTARASVPEGIEPVQKWLKKHGFPELEVTNAKDFHMIELWDDRAIQVIANTGKAVIRLGLRTQPKSPTFAQEQSDLTCELGNTSSHITEGS